MTKAKLLESLLSASMRKKKHEFFEQFLDTHSRPETENNEPQQQMMMACLNRELIKQEPTATASFDIHKGIE